jgi:homospermidine synthase
MVWALENPNRGTVEPDEIDYRRVLDIADPYLGNVVGQYSDWTPLKDRGWLYNEDADVDRSDPWQFKNFRVD